MTSFLKRNYNLIFKKLNTMKTLKQQYQDLEFQVNVEYRTLIDKIGTIDFFIESEDEDFEETLEQFLITNKHI